MRRLRRYRFSRQWLETFFQGGAKYSFKVDEGWPADAKIEKVEFDGIVVTMTVHSEAFAAVRGGEVPAYEVKASKSQQW